MVLIGDLSSDATKNVQRRSTLEKIAYSGNLGRARTAELHRMLYENGPGNGTMLSLPFDQLIEHGVGHTLMWERSADPEAVIELGNRGNFSAIAMPYGLAEKYQNRIRTSLPLIVKVDGHFSVGDKVRYPRHSSLASVEKAVEAGANAIGFTFYFGGEETEQDAERCSRIVEEAHRFGKPVFMWAYARGPMPKEMGADSLFWCAQAVAAGENMGVDVIKQKFPAPAKDKTTYTTGIESFKSSMPRLDELLRLEPEDPNNVPYELNVKRLSFMAQMAPNTILIISGGPKIDDPKKELIETTRIVMDAGCEGRIVGRNMWGIPINKALDLNREVADLMSDEKYRRILKEPRFTGEY